MPVVVFAPRRSRGAAALRAALEAGLGTARLFHVPEQAAAAVAGRTRPVLVLDLREEAEPARALRVAQLAAACPGAALAALLPAGDGTPPAGCDAVFVAPFYLEDVVHWCARVALPPLAEGILQDMAAGLSHEIGNPLTTLLLQLQLLKADGARGTASEPLAVIEESARRIQSVVRDVAAAGERRPVQAGPVILERLLAKTRERLTARDPELARRVDLTCEDAPLMADAPLLSDALADVWEYLLRAGERGERLRVAAGRRESGLLLIRHRAHTPRLPEDAAERLFTPLWARQALGLPEGLSLTTARNTFLRHRGDLRARSGPQHVLTLDAWLPAGTQEVLSFPAERAGPRSQRA